MEQQPETQGAEQTRSEAAGDHHNAVEVKRDAERGSSNEGRSAAE
jgi:ATP-dependent Clp protease ATP-binding subunit ClpC